MKDTVTPGYQETLVQMHKEFKVGVGKDWGRSGGAKIGSRIVDFVMKQTIKSVLDFGAGQCTLEKYVAEHSKYALDWTNYDPGIAGIDERPDDRKKFDLVVTSDVLEHIEPKLLNSVLQYLAQMTGGYQYHYIACDPCNSTLPDGRNAHLIQEEPDWWRLQLQGRGHREMFYSDEWLSSVARPNKRYACIVLAR